MTTCLVDYQASSSSSEASSHSGSVDHVASTPAADSYPATTAQHTGAVPTSRQDAGAHAGEPPLKRVRAFEHREGQWAVSVHLPGACPVQDDPPECLQPDTGLSSQACSPQTVTAASSSACRVPRMPAGHYRHVHGKTARAQGSGVSGALTRQAAGILVTLPRGGGRRAGRGMRRGAEQRCREPLCGGSPRRRGRRSGRCIAERVQQCRGTAGRRAGLAHQLVAGTACTACAAQKLTAAR